jgi:uncharacterized protein
LTTQRTLARIDEVAAADWNALLGADCPFLRHEFLAALEHSGCVGAGTGWQPAHLAMFDGARLIAAAPVYEKQHSWGEFVFDFGWAQAYERHGLAYYPKLVCAVPFSPINGARLLQAADRAGPELTDLMIQALEQRCAESGLSSAHALFVTDTEAEAFRTRNWLIRRDVQFHWHNQGYSSFDHYLETFRSEKRKQVRRERRRCAEMGIGFRTLTGSQITAAERDIVYDMHARTFLAHGHTPYLNRDCFDRLAANLGDALMVKLALQGETPVAAAIFFASADTLYGRYWGALGEFHSLHFETCYHQGIEYCIEHGIQRFEPGTQGEHKVARGFAPSYTHSAHYIAHAGFRDAIAAFLHRESAGVAQYADQINAHTPFRRG